MEITNGVPWERYADKKLFGRDGEAPFKRYSAEYDDFKDFYLRYKKFSPQQNAKKSTAEDDLEYTKRGLDLFKQFQDKKREKLKEKISEQREALPIKPFERSILHSLQNNKVILIAADTGAGKSTQVPQYLMNAGFERIACTQPRRIACFSLAKRVSYESLNIYGNEVGYKVRFDGTVTNESRLIFLTEVLIAHIQGVLLKQFSSDPYLQMYDVIIVDEVHERHITGDFLLGVLKRLIQYREDIRIVLMSATINAKLFGQYFNAPVIEVPGRMFPVSIEYHPVDEEDHNLVDPRIVQDRFSAEHKQSVSSKNSKIKSEPYLKLMERIDQKYSQDERGDLLIFVSGMNEIDILFDQLNNYAAYTRRWIILRLHSSLSVEEQELVFDIAPEGTRKCIISTNIAETSVTIDGIRFIIDSGKVKELGFDTVHGFSKLSEFWISKSSAKQRSGRAGRTGPGECFRFYTVKEFEGLNEYPVPEILRTPLDHILLDIKALDLGDPLEFDFIEAPPEGALRSSLNRLYYLGCMENSGEITDMGRVLSNLPVDLVIGKMMVLGSISELMSPIITIASVLSVQSPFSRISESQHNILENRRTLHSSHGDPFTLLNLFTEWLHVKSEDGSKSRKWCQRHGVEEQRLYEIVKIRQQFEQALKVCTTTPNEEEVTEVTNNLSSLKYDYQRQKDDADALRKKFAKRLLEKKKRESNIPSRKFLKLSEEKDNSLPDIDASAVSSEPLTIQELEFVLQNDPRYLLEQSDVNLLTVRDINIVKLIVAAGTYPNIVIPDEANFARPITEHIYHSKGKRFLSVHPTSVFAYNPKAIDSKHVPSSNNNTDKSLTLDTLHGSVRCKELLCYLELLETSKPFLMNVTRVSALPIMLLYGQEIIISPDMKHLIVDDWLHFEFDSQVECCDILSRVVSIRESWMNIVNQQLKIITNSQNHNKAKISGENNPSLSFEEKFCMNKSTEQPTTTDEDDKDLFQKLEYVPEPIRRIRKEWTERAKNRNDKEQYFDEVMDKLAELVDLEVNYFVERLKMQSVVPIFGYDPFSTDEEERQMKRSISIAPNYKFFLSKESKVVNNMDLNLFTLPKIIPRSDTKAIKRKIAAIEEEKSEVTYRDYVCTICKLPMKLTTTEIFRHKSECKKPT